MDNHAVATAFGILGAVLWSLHSLPQIWKTWRRHSRGSLSPLFFLAGAAAGIPLGVYNIVDDFNIALQIQPNILSLPSLITWSQCKHYGHGLSWTKTLIVSLLLAVIFGGIETGLVSALRLGRDRGHEWPSTLMAIVAAVILAGGVKILGLVIYGPELAIWIGLICLVCCFQISHRTKSKDPDPILEDV
ncbi:PQ loop repeat protein-like protein [Aureobasidium pullulans]|uniref:PQ loop repeat protein-like protein n=2 Tax=Aureobasidium pullulans TaxID=5580 RepID=A0A4S8XJE0_AURPU|nr:PQ loop repeat protein-like protein [Aureobasidium pullulans]THX28916.1 PQ loop repeat protein-like protein [Aureobasidium pullulans]